MPLIHREAVCIPSFSAGCPLIEPVSVPPFVHSRLYSRSDYFPRASRKALQSRLQALSRLGVVKELIVKFNRDFPRMPPFMHGLSLCLPLWSNNQLFVSCFALRFHLSHFFYLITMRSVLLKFYGNVYLR